MDPSYFFVEDLTILSYMCGFIIPFNNVLNTEREVLYEDGTLQYSYTTEVSVKYPLRLFDFKEELLPLWQIEEMNAGIKPGPVALWMHALVCGQVPDQEISQLQRRLLVWPNTKMQIKLEAALEIRNAV